MSNLFAHPGGDALTHALFEGGAEGAVAVVATLLRQLLGDDGFMCSGKLAVAGYEVTDAEVVDVCIVACALTGEILAEIVVVDADGCRELRKDFEAGVDCYLEGCKADGVEPTKPYSGKLNLRMSSELHSRVAAFVAATGTTINDFINRAITNELKKVAVF